MRGRRRRPTPHTFQAAGEGGAVARAAATWAVDVSTADGWSSRAGLRARVAVARVAAAMAWREVLKGREGWRGGISARKSE